MTETSSPAMAFHQHEFLQPPQATVSLSETSLEDQMMAPMTPDSQYIKDEDDEDDQGDKKTAKKRKSWGQELPTPKTNLPPRYALPDHHSPNPSHANYSIRKRAKTEDEKEQRRIERVLRNRAAAQSSRERKRQEVEKLEGEKATIEQQNQYLKDRLMAVEHEKFQLQQQLTKVTAQMKAMSEGSATPSTAASPAPEPQVFDHLRIKQEIDDYSLAATPQTFSSPSTMTYSPSQSPSQPSLSFDDESLATSPDMTQHPAEMLCDLQCQSAEACQTPSTQSTTLLTPATTAIPSSSANPLMSLILISAVYSQLMIPLHMILTALKTHSRFPTSSSTIPISPSTAMISGLIHWLISTQTNLMTSPSDTTAMTSTLVATTTRVALVRRLNILHSLLLSSPPLARPLKDATGRTLRVQTSTMMSRQSRNSQGSGSKVVHRICGKAGQVDGVRSINRRGNRGASGMPRSTRRAMREIVDMQRKRALCRIRQR